MTDDIQSPAPAPAEVLTEAAPSPDKPVEVSPPPPEPKKTPEQSRSDAVKKAMDKAFADEPKEDEAEPAEPAAKPQKSEAKPETDKPAAAPDETAETASEAKKPDSPVQHKPDNAPEKLAPHAREQWRHVPKVVKEDFQRIMQAHEDDTRQYQEDRQFRESLRQYDDLARKAGTTIDKALERYVDIDKRLTSGDPNTRARTVLEVMQAGNVDPVAFARSILANEGQFKQQPQAPRDPMVAQMAQQVQQLTAHIQQQEMAQRAAPLQQTLEQFSADKADFAALEQDIAEILKSGIIQKRFPGLSPDQLLTEAYRRAGGAYLSRADAQAVPAATTDEPAPERPRNPAGLKSVSGAPQGEPRPVQKKLSRSAAVEKAMREAGL